MCYITDEVTDAPRRTHPETGEEYRDIEESFVVESIIPDPIVEISPKDRHMHVINMECSEETQCTIQAMSWAIRNGNHSVIGKDYLQEKNIATVLLVLRADEENKVHTFSIDPHVILAYQDGDKINAFVSVSPLIHAADQKPAKSEVLHYFRKNYPNWKIDWSMPNKCKIVQDPLLYYNAIARSFQWKIQKRERSK